LLLQLGQADIHGRSTSLSQPLHVISKPPSHRLLRDGFGFGSTGRTVLNMDTAASVAAALKAASMNKAASSPHDHVIRVHCLPATSID
jgi:hypothetical protein